MQMSGCWFAMCMSTKICFSDWNLQLSCPLIWGLFLYQVQMTFQLFLSERQSAATYCMFETAIPVQLLHLSCPKSRQHARNRSRRHCHVTFNNTCLHGGWKCCVLFQLVQSCHWGGKVTTRLRFLQGHIKTHIIIIIIITLLFNELLSVPLNAIFTSQIVNWCTLQTTGGVS